MSRDSNRNLAHSIFQRLLNLSKSNNDDFNLLLSRYGMERLLYRLSTSSYNDRFILKGATLFLVWMGQNYRVTRDADLLGLVAPDLNNLAEIFGEICNADCDSDGMIYKTDTLKIEEIREGQEYGGVRVTLVGVLNTARIPLQIDIGFGDAVTPCPEDIEYPTIFDAPRPKLRAYPRYTMVAEKLEAMVRLDLANSRMKDFYDIWLLSKLFPFKGEILCKAIKNTFVRRDTALPCGVPFALTSEFYEDQQKKVQWNAFVRKAKPNVHVKSLSLVAAEISRFLQPVIANFQSNSSFDEEWVPEKGWSPKQ